MKSTSKIIITAIFSIALAACGDYLDVNENPNNPIKETLPLKAKLPAAQVASVNQETGELNQIGALWGGYWGTTNEGISMFVDLKTYNGPAIRHQRDGIQVWEDVYTTMLYYKLIWDEAEEEGASMYAGISKIMIGWHFMRLVDLYNAVPFDEALAATLFPTPKYEDGRTVYQKSIDLITEGIEDIKSAAPGTEAKDDDLIFKGDKSLWAKFGNTAKLRALLRQSQVSEQMAYIISELQKIEVEGSGFLSVGENAFLQPGYLNTAGKLNPFWEGYYRSVQGVNTANHQDIRPTVFAIEQYQRLNDPRLSNLYVDIDGSYNGVLFGNPDTAPEFARANTSAFKGPEENGGAPAALFKSYDQPSVLMASFESLFLQAEAAQRGWIDGSPKLFFEQAIQESFDYMEVDPSEFAAYNDQPDVNLDQASDKIARIIEQKWLALNSISSIEAWNDFRRLGLPQIPNSLEAPSPTSRPLRFMYPETERMTNNEEAAKQGGDDMLNDSVWWDK